MNIDPTVTTEDKSQKLVIACAINATDGKPYPLVIDPTTGELRVNAEFTGQIAVALDATSLTPPDLGDNVALQLLNETDDGFVKIQANATLRAMLVAVERLKDSDGNEIKADDNSPGADLNALNIAIRKIRDSDDNEAKIDAGKEALQVDIKTLGQAAMAASVPVTMANDQPDVNVNMTNTNDAYDATRDRWLFDPVIAGRMKSYEDTSFVVGESPRTLDINTDLGKNGRAGYIAIDGPGDITIEISDDGASWGDPFTLKSQDSFDLTRLDVDSIRLTHVADTAYRIVVI